ncbi:MAG: sigma-70 family RNA polymerase sigma factor [Verrucomicrobiota bacterium]|nr:sigma-70 family RNA polymerase sigma factor [Verrucomicrobiota bacterium]
MAETTDKELLTRYRRGDVDALGVLVEKYRRPLFAFILNMIGGQNEADEIFQEVWFRAIRSLAGYEERNFFGWLARIAHNFVIDRARRKRSDVSLDEELADGVPLRDAIPGATPDPEREIEKKDLAARLAKAVECLPAEQKEVFLMRIQADLPFKEIARAQKVSINTALARMQYALAKLRPMLREYQSA